MKRIDTAAGFSDDRRYRYWLSRSWAVRERRNVVWIMLNPSTADENVDDPTIRRCCAFAEAWGYNAIEVRNLFNWRSADPSELKDVDDPIGGIGADLSNEFAMCGARPIIAAWGTFGTLLGRNEAIIHQLRHAPVWCLGTTKEGHPRHPLYMRGDTVPVPFNEKARETGEFPIFGRVDANLWGEQ